MSTEEPGVEGQAPPAPEVVDPLDQQDRPGEANYTSTRQNPWRQRAREYDSQYKGPVHWRHVINVIAATGQYAIACREAGVSVQKFNEKRERYKEFAEAVIEAQVYFRQAVLEKAALTRAVDGWLEPVFYQGDEVGYVRKFSDSLLGKLLEGNSPDKFRSKSENSDGKLTINVKGGLPDKAAAAAADVPEEELPLPPQPKSTAQ